MTMVDLYSALADGVESMTDEDLLAEACARGEDPEVERTRLQAFLREFLDES